MLAEIKKATKVDEEAERVRDEKDKAALRREAARIMAEMSIKGGDARPQRPSTAKSTKSELKETPKDQKGPWVAPMIASVKSAKKETFKSAVPTVTETALSNQYEKYSKLSEVSVVKTVMDDLRKESEEETSYRLQEE
jgi:hypothetical protein